MELFILFIEQIVLYTCIFFLGYVKGEINLHRNVLNGKEFIEAPILYYFISPEEAESELSIKKPSGPITYKVPR